MVPKKREKDEKGEQQMSAGRGGEPGAGAFGTAGLVQLRGRLMPSLAEEESGGSLVRLRNEAPFSCDLEVVRVLGRRGSPRCCGITVKIPVTPHRTEGTGCAKTRRTQERPRKSPGNKNKNKYKNRK